MGFEGQPILNEKDIDDALKNQSEKTGEMDPNNDGAILSNDSIKEAIKLDQTQEEIDPIEDIQRHESEYGIEAAAQNAQDQYLEDMERYNAEREKRKKEIYA